MYRKGAWWPASAYDMAWSAEFVEHVDEQYIMNYMSTFKRAKYILITHATWGGWHHTCVHNSQWWIQTFESYGFAYQHDLTLKAREQCPLGSKQLKYSYHVLSPRGNRMQSHFLFHGLVFINRYYFNRLTPFDLQFMKLLRTHH